MQLNWRNHIYSDTNVLMGKPVIKGTRISVDLILELLASGWTRDMLMESYPALSDEKLNAVFAYLRECIEEELFFPNKKVA